ncbi:MAG: DNA internalization-related competence protein ComEC/Rec2, partial [Acinetobacter sp.]
MLQWLCIGWILGLACMGKSFLSIQLSATAVLICVLLCYLIVHKFSPVIHSPLRRFILTGVSLLLGLCLGHGYANLELTERLATREHDVSEKEIVVHIKDLNKLGAQTIQQALHVLNPDGSSVKWMGVLPVPAAVTQSRLINRETQQQTLALGQYYLLQGQIRPHHSYATPGSFDAEKWALQQNLMAGFRIKHIQELQPQQLYASGYGKYLGQQQKLKSRFLLWVERQRLLLREFITRQPVQHKGLILALLTGDESLLDQATEQQFQRFGMSHLLAISGPHVLIFAFMFCGILQYLISRCIPHIYLKWPRQYFLSLPFLLCVLLYCAFVGFEIPALRTLLICVIVTLTLFTRQSVQPLKLLILSAALLLLFDPFSILSAAFWLSYGACFVLLRIYQTIQQQPRQTEQTVLQRLYFAVKVLVESQWKIFLALFPLMMLFFKQIAWITPFSNLVAIPWIGLFIVPVDILAALLFFISEPLSSVVFQCNDILIHMLLVFLDLLDQLFHPQLIPVAMNVWMIMLCILALMIAFLPRGLLPKSWTALACVPLCMPQFNQHAFQLSILDVGQGQAIFIRDGPRSMMIDMGGYYDEEKFSIGRQVILPFLSVQGVGELDQLILTHLDQDHSAAYHSIKHQLKIKEVFSNQIPEIASSSRFQFCHQGQQWQWSEDIQFKILAPQPHQLNTANFNKNDRSCIVYLQVKNAGP